MRIDTKAAPLPLSSELVEILEKEIVKAKPPAGEAVTLTFHDPEYSPEHGGFHPVEIRIGPTGKVEYITDFSYAGLAPFAELVKELDFDFRLGLFQHFGREYPIRQGREMFALWMENFVSYYEMEIFQVAVEAG